MPTGPASTADEIAESIRNLIDRVADAKFTQEMAKRGQDVAGVLADRGSDVGDRAAVAWRDAAPMRRDAAKRLSRATDDAARWSDRTWRKAIRPALKDLWKRRTVALGAAGAAVPASRELVDTAAVRLGLRQQEERHWGAFFFGLLLGAIGGAVVALLMAPKRGDEMRRELGVKADEVRQELATRADEIATKAKDAEWVPIFQREGDEVTNGQPADPAPDVISDATSSAQEAAADAGTATSEVAEQAADETAEAINESYDTVDREARP
jgi:gas vesicle protein